MTTGSNKYLLLAAALTSALWSGYSYGSSDSLKQDLEISLGTLKDDKSDISDVLLEVERVDFLTPKGWRSVKESKSWKLGDSKDEDTQSAITLPQAEGCSKVKLVLNRRKHGMVRDYRGHECVIKENSLVIDLKESLSLQDREKASLKVLIDLKETHFSQNKNRECVLKPRIKVVSVWKDKVCLKKEGREKEDHHKHQRRLNWGLLVSSLQHEKNKCKGRRPVVVKGSKCEVYSEIPAQTNPGTSPTVPVVTLPVVTEPTAPVTTTPTVPVNGDPSNQQQGQVSGPVISGFRVFEVFLSGAVVGWVTDVPSTTQVV